MPKSRRNRHSVTQPCDTSYRFIPLTQGQNATVDVEDFEWLDQWNWYAQWNKHTKSFYAQREARSASSRTRTVRMHKAVLNCGSSEIVDHINHDTLDNRKANLRKCTHKENSRNRRGNGFKGVRQQARNTWATFIKVDGTFRFVGQFKSPEEAAKAYDVAAKQFYGAFACLNFPTSNSSA